MSNPKDGISILGIEGYYNLTPIDTNEEIKETVRALMRDWKAWAKRMDNHDNEALRQCGSTIRICIHEVEITFKIPDTSKQRVTAFEKPIKPKPKTTRFKKMEEN